MKKTALILAALMAFAAAGCEKKADSESSDISASESISATEAAGEDETSAAEDDKASEGEKVPEKTEAATAEKATEAETDASSEEEKDPFDSENIEDKVIEAAQELFGRACEAEWDFTVGSPYDIDPENYIENSYGWQFFLITDPDINTIEDVRNDYHRIFSSSREDNLEEIFIEHEGRAYSFNGARGSDVFYEGSEITEITEKGEGMICFKVVNSYSDDGFGNGPRTIEDEFSIVREQDGWKVEKFSLPY